jgi:hypothetical protein
MSGLELYAMFAPLEFGLIALAFAWWYVRH